MNPRLKYLLIAGVVGIIVIALVVFFVFSQRSIEVEEAQPPAEQAETPKDGWGEDYTDSFLSFETMVENFLPGVINFDSEAFETPFYLLNPQPAETPSVTPPVAPPTIPDKTEASPQPTAREGVVVHSPAFMEAFYLGETANIRWTGGPKDKKLIITIKDSPLACGDDPICVSLINSMAPEIVIASDVPNTGSFVWKTGKNPMNEEIYPDVYILRIRSEKGELLGESSSFAVKSREFEGKEIMLINPVQAMSEAEVNEFRKTSLDAFRSFVDYFSETDENFESDLKQIDWFEELEYFGLTERDLKNFGKENLINFFAITNEKVGGVFWPKILGSENDPGQDAGGTILWRAVPSVIFVNISIWPCPIGKRVDECAMMDGWEIMIFEKYRSLMNVAYWNGKTDYFHSIVPPGRYVMVISSYYNPKIRSGPALINVTL